jgi:hypothetical protein
MVRVGVITLTKQQEKYVLMNTLEKKEVLQEQLIKMLQTSGFEGVVPFELRTVRNKRVILHDLTDLYSILTRLQTPIDSRELVLILKALLDSIKTVSQKRIPPSYVDLDLDYIFIRRDGKVLLTIWAIEGLAPKTPLPKLLQQIGELAKPLANKDKNFIEGYLDLFDAGFTLEKLDKFINNAYEMLQRSVVDGEVRKADPFKDELMANENRVTTRPTPPQPATSVQEVVEEEEEFLEPTNKTTFLADVDAELDEDDGKTTLLVSDNDLTRYIIRLNTGDRYDLSQGENILGKVGADIAFTDNKAISRRHAKIRIFDGVVTIEDLNSSNGTKINGTRLNPNETANLVDGDVFTLANEDFEYHEE